MIKIDGKMKVAASMVKTILEGMLHCKIETGWSFSKNTYMLVYVYDKDSKYDYQKFELEYLDDGNKDDSDYCAELVYQMLNGMSDYYKASCEQRYIQDILEEIGVQKLFILDGRLCDNNNEISICLDALDICKFDRIEASFILIDETGDKFEVDLCEECIRIIEDK